MAQPPFEYTLGRKGPLQSTSLISLTACFVIIGRDEHDSEFESSLTLML